MFESINKAHDFANDMLKIKKLAYNQTNELINTEKSSLNNTIEFYKLCKAFVSDLKFIHKNVKTIERFDTIVNNIEGYLQPYEAIYQWVGGDPNQFIDETLDACLPDKEHIDFTDLNKATANLIANNAFFEIQEQRRMAIKGFEEFDSYLKALLAQKSSVYEALNEANESIRKGRVEFQHQEQDKNINAVKGKAEQTKYKQNERLDRYTHPRFNHLMASVMQRPGKYDLFSKEINKAINKINIEAISQHWLNLTVIVENIETKYEQYPDDYSEELSALNKVINGLPNMATHSNQKDAKEYLQHLIETIGDVGAFQQCKENWKFIERVGTLYSQYANLICKINAKEFNNTNSIYGASDDYNAAIEVIQKYQAKLINVKQTIIQLEKRQNNLTDEIKKEQIKSQIQALKEEERLCQDTVNNASNLIAEKRLEYISKCHEIERTLPTLRSESLKMLNVYKYLNLRKPEFSRVEREQQTYNPQSELILAKKMEKSRRHSRVANLRKFRSRIFSGSFKDRNKHSAEHSSKKTFTDPKQPPVDKDELTKTCNSLKKSKSFC